MTDEINNPGAPVEVPLTNDNQINPPTVRPTRRTLIILFSVILVTFLGIAFALKIAGTKKNKPETAVTITPRPTPTPERLLSPVATQSAFLALSGHVASLSAGINNFVLDDPQLTPPLIDLPLGF